MADVQLWPTGTTIGLQTFAGGRLRFLPGDPSRGSRLEFEFARTQHDVVIHQVLPPVRFYGPPIKPPVAHVSEPKLYQIVQANNRYLRTQHPEVDLPKSLLLEYILEDQELPEKDQPLLSSMLAGLSIDKQHDLIVSVGGPLGNELYCMFIENGQFDVPKLRTSAKSAATLRTPVQQLCSGPSLNQDGNAVFLARTHDATTLFTYSSSNNGCITDHRFDMGYQLKTSDTDHERHVDCCVGHTINDTLHQFILLNSKAELWKVSGIGGKSSVRQVGQIKHSEPHNITWARCGIYPSNDCLVVGLRDSVGMVDPRLNGECSDLYTVSDGHRITDIQRYINNRSPHLRLINTTSSMIWIDDRKPNVPMMAVKHFRSHDLTLSMSFSSEPEWSPHPTYSLSTAAERFDKVLLWSRANDVASLHQFKSHPGIPPAVLGYPSAVPVTSSLPPNSRTGLVFFRRLATEYHPEKLCLVEMKRDGSLWHQQIGLFDSSDHPLSANPPRRSLGSELVEESFEKLDSDDDGGIIHIPNTTLQLDIICQDFTKACLSDSPSTDPLITSTLPCNDFLDPLSFCKLPKTSEPWIAATQDAPVLDISPVLHNLLPASASLLAEDSPMMDQDEPRVGTYFLRQKVADILATARSLSMKTPAPISPRGEESQITEGGSMMDEGSSSLAVDRLMEEWQLGEPTSNYQWSDVCAATHEEGGDPSGAESDYPTCLSPSRGARSQSGLSGIEHDHEAARWGREDTVDVMQVASRGMERRSAELSILTTPKAAVRTSQAAAHDHPQPVVPYPSPTLPRPTLHHPSHLLLNSNSQPVPFLHNPPSPPSISNFPSQPYSQFVPGPHAARSASTRIPPRKKKRVGGF